MSEIIKDDFNTKSPQEESFYDAHEMFKEMRDKCPVAYSGDLGGFWGLFKYDDVVHVLTNPKTYLTSVQNVVPRVSRTTRRPPLHLDPPEHTPYRTTLNPFFRKDRIEKLEPKIKKTIESLVKEFVDKGEGDISEDLFHKIPGYVFAHFFNLTPELSMKIREATKRFAGSLYETNQELVLQASLELYEIAESIIEMRKKNPMDPSEDVTSAYLARKYKGEHLPDELILGTIRQLIVVGMIAPVVFMGSVTFHLTENQDLQNKLRNDLSLVPRALEEYYRLMTPYRGFARTAKHDVTIGGRKIKKDEPMALVFSSANRDEDVFPNGDEFILDRPNIDKHIAFGLGPHHCPGQNLARLMITVTFEELLSRTESIERTKEIQMAGWPEWGVLSLPVKLELK